MRRRQIWGKEMVSLGLMMGATGHGTTLFSKQVLSVCVQGQGDAGVDSLHPPEPFPPAHWELEVAGRWLAGGWQVATA